MARPAEKLLVLVENDVRQVVEAPADFDWLAYPDQVEMLGCQWRYVGCQEGTPIYRNSAPV